MTTKVLPLVQRITLKSGRTKRTLVIVQEPFARVGDVCTVNGRDWTVVKVKMEKNAVSIRFPGAKMQQVFP